jgi:alanyl-tRNA synthetase
MQYSRDSSGELSPLPEPSIDTGMGIERLAAVLQGKVNNFDSDLFIPVIKHVEDISGKKFGGDPSKNVSMRVIADHMRAAAFVLSEGLTPSNEGRGYVLRRIIRRAARHGFMLGIEGPFLYEVLDTVYEVMDEPYPELVENAQMNKKVLKFEEERFAHTLSSGMSMLDEIMDKIKSSGKDTIPGSEIFKLYDTFGFPLDLAKDIAEDNRLKIDEQGFAGEMELQKNRARASWVGVEEEVSGAYREIGKLVASTEFLGYETLQTDSVINALIKDGELAEEATEGEDVEIVLDKTPFYGESGGQVGDRGVIKTDKLKIEVRDTRKIGKIPMHIGVIKKGTVSRGMAVGASVEEGRRKSIMRNHTATHLLHAALKAVLGDHIKQAGSLVTPDRLRFDFSHFFAMDDREIGEVEDIVNEKIIENMPVDVTEKSIGEAISEGVTALFGEKYGESVRVVRAGDFTAELCGGTHCRATGDIGLFKIISEGSVAAGVRRIEAFTGLSALEYGKSRENELRKTAGLLKVNELMVFEKVEKALDDLKQSEKELEKIKHGALTGNAAAIIEKAVEIDNVKVIAHKTDGLDIKALRRLADTLKNKIGSGVIILGSAFNGQAYYVSAVTKDLVPRFNAGEILKAVTGGKGGGRPDMAQGGTKDVRGIDKAIFAAPDIIKGKMK